MGERIQPRIKKTWCKACRLCIVFCPRKVFKQDEFGRPIIANPENCIACHMCEYRCPDFALELYR